MSNENTLKKNKNILTFVYTFVGLTLLVLVGIIAIPKFSQANKTVGMPNPLTEVKTIEEANALTGFSAKVPAKLYFTPEAVQYTVIGKNTFQVVYKNSNNIEVTYRMSSLKQDVSGVYNKYAVTDNVTISNFEVTLKGDAKNKYLLATWYDGTYSYSVYSTIAMTLEEFTALLNSIK